MFWVDGDVTCHVAGAGDWILAPFWFDSEIQSRNVAVLWVIHEDTEALEKKACWGERKKRFTLILALLKLLEGWLDGEPSATQLPCGIQRTSRSCAVATFYFAY